MARKLDRLEAKRLFVEEKKEVAEIAKLRNIPEKTIYRWKSDDADNGNDWDAEREAVAMTAHTAGKQMLVAVIAAMEEAVKTIKATGKVNPSEIYGIRQLILSAKALEKDVDHYGNIILTIQEFADFLNEESPELLKQLEPFLVKFGNSMSKKYGRK